MSNELNVCVFVLGRKMDLHQSNQFNSRTVSNQLLVPEQAQMILVQMKQTTVAAPALTATDGSYSGFKIINLKSYSLIQTIFVQNALISALVITDDSGKCVE